MTLIKETRPWDHNNFLFEPVINTDEEPLFRYRHSYQGKETPLQINKLTLGRSDAGNCIAYTINTLTDEQLGFIQGFLVNHNDLVIFEANNSINTQRNQEEFASYQEQKVPIPRVVGSAVAQLIRSGIIHIWYSSFTLRPMGRAIYDRYLRQQKDLSLVPYEFEDGDGYIVTLHPHTSDAIPYPHLLSGP